MIGPPATAKSLFLMELGRLKGSYIATGSRVSGAGLTDALFTYQPVILVLDEVDKIPMDVTAVLLSVMESGDILETKYKRHRGLKLDLVVCAAGNSDRTMPPELLSRFDTKLYFSPYSFEEFISVCAGYLTRCENIPGDIAEYIGKQTWHQASSDNWQRVVNRGSFGVKPQSPSIRAVKEAQPGEPCVAYVSGQKLFAGLGKITRGYYYDKTSDFPHRVGLEVKLNLANGVRLDSTKNVVQFIKDKNNPGKDLRRAMRRIPLSDYEVIKAGLKSDTQGEFEKLAEREGHELISIPIEPIDTHAKAEGALLELGNCLEEYETYVTLAEICCYNRVNHIW